MVERDALNDVAILHERVAAASTREPELLSNASAVSDQLTRAIDEFRQECDTISPESKELAKHVQLK